MVEPDWEQFLHNADMKCLHPNVVVRPAPGQTSASISFDSDPKFPLITIYGDDDVTLVSIHRDGSATIPDETKLNEAAQLFIKTVGEVLQQQLVKEGPFLVRKRGTTAFFSIECELEQWVQDPKEAIHFARELDAICMIGVNASLEVVPLDKVMVL